MGDPVICCLLQICCPPADQREAWVRWLMAEAGLTDDQAGKTADLVLGTFDVAEKGTLKPLKDSIAKLARRSNASE